MVAVGADPLRESAQQALIEAHFAEGNWAEGRRRYEVYRELLRRELGVQPSRQLDELVYDDPVTTDRYGVRLAGPGAPEGPAAGPTARISANRGRMPGSGPCATPAYRPGRRDRDADRVPTE
jgi:hypothetical protein